jgi:hypothetical protein
MCALTDDKPAVVIDREPDQEKSLDPSGPRMRLDAAQRRQMVLRLRTRMEHLRYRGSVPVVPPPLDFYPVPQVWRLVAAFGVVCAVNRDKCLLEQTR